MSLLTILGAPPDAVLPTPQTENFKYTSLRALNNKASKLVPTRLGLVAEQALLSHAKAPIATIEGRTASTGFFAQLAGQQLGYSACLEGLHYFQIAPVAEFGLVQQHHCIRIAKGTQACIVWHHTGNQNDTLVNLLSRFDVEEQASLKLIRVQTAAPKASVFERTEIQLGGESTLELVDVNFGAELSRHELSVDLRHPKAQANIMAAACLNTRQHHDLQLSLQHMEPHTTSNTRIKTIAKQRARAVIGGRIYVAKGADQTDAQLKTQNLLLSADAEIDAKPELEIHADEVICAHGATIGQLDQNALFYLRSRGLDEASAKSLLTFAFAEEILARIEQAEVRDKLSQMLRDKLT
jgi:Fe-S cluster assembly protein SufD